MGPRAEEDKEKAQFIFTIDFKTFIKKSSIDPEFGQMRICKKKNKIPEEQEGVFEQF